MFPRHHELVELLRDETAAAYHTAPSYEQPEWNVCELLIIHRVEVRLQSRYNLLEKPSILYRFAEEVIEVTCLMLCNGTPFPSTEEIMQSLNDDYIFWMNDEVATKRTFTTAAQALKEMLALRSRYEGRKEVVFGFRGLPGDQCEIDLYFAEKVHQDFPPIPRFIRTLHRLSDKERWTAKGKKAIELCTERERRRSLGVLSGREIQKSLGFALSDQNIKTIQLATMALKTNNVEVGELLKCLQKRPDLARCDNWKTMATAVRILSAFTRKSSPS